MSKQKCRATCSDGSECQAWAMDDSNRCRHHGGKTPTADENPNVGRGDQEGNRNAEKHALYSDKDGYYHGLSESEQQWVFDFTNDLLDRQRRLQGREPDKFDKEALKNIAIDFHRVATANSWFQSRGLAPDDHKVTPQGGVVAAGKKVNEWASEIRQYNESIYRRMQKHGLLHDPESEKASELGNLASVIDENQR